MPRTYGNLWPQVINIENLYHAAYKASRGRRFKDNVLRFNFDLERQVQRLQEELRAKTYLPGPYHSFWITDPKPRMISAAPFRDRVVHHALISVIAPLAKPRPIPPIRTSAATRAARISRCARYVVVP